MCFPVTINGGLGLADTEDTQAIFNVLYEQALNIADSVRSNANQSVQVTYNLQVEDTNTSTVISGAFIANPDRTATVSRDVRLIQPERGVNILVVSAQNRTLKA